MPTSPTELDRPSPSPTPGPPRWWSGRSGIFQEEGVRGALIAVVSTVLFVLVAGWLILNSEAWPEVQQQFFNLEKFREVFPAIARGFWLDIRMFLAAEVLILIFSLLIAVARSLRGPAFFPIRALAILYIDLIRGIPIILLILLLGFGVPALQLPGVPNSALFWGLTALIMSYCAYTAEVYRAGIESVHDSQRMSAKSLGLTQVQTLRFVILPQAVRNVVPALLNGFVSLQKDVALVFVLGIREGVREADIFAARTFNYTGYVVAAILFLLVSVPVARFTDWYTERDRQRRASGT